jgi:NAD(P)-dependent dehydrogenase (short-subunit alcohol dehydrogenase family)
MDYRKAFDLTGSVAVVTGGPRGIGVESAVALGPCGAKVVLAARDRNAVDTAVENLERRASTPPALFWRARMRSWRNKARSTSSSMPAALGSTRVLVLPSLRASHDGAASRQKLRLP